MSTKAKKDHRLIHSFAKDLRTASVRHALVENGMYGVPSTVYLDQDILTKAQIADMHAEWVKQNEAPGVTHETPMAASTSKEVEHINRWDTKLIKDLTKKDIFRYYSTPGVKKALHQELKDNPFMTRQKMDSSTSWITRPSLLSQLTNNSDAKDQGDLQYYIERRHVEMHKKMHKRTNKIIIDIDPGTKVSQENTKKIALYLEKYLELQPFITDTEIQFSGNTGYYIWATTTTTMDIDVARNKLKDLLTPLNRIEGVSTTVKPTSNPNRVRLDLSPMKENGAIKAVGSLDHRSGLRSMIVAKHRLMEFNPEVDANINKLSLKPAYSFKDESLI